jgi:type III restriction enzyme
MKESKTTNGDSKPTIVKQLINGSGSVPGIPIVWGISATVERFNLAMAGMQGRDTLSNVIVDSKKVQDSGLLKDTIVLDVPDEDAGDFSTVLLRRGTDKLKEISEAWAEYPGSIRDAASGRAFRRARDRRQNAPNHGAAARICDTAGRGR